MSLLGGTLRKLQQVSVTAVPSLPGAGEVITHGDFGPQNMLFDIERGVVTAILDWEFAHRGKPVEDLAWAEWIIRMHHPEVVDSLPALLAGAPASIGWSERHEAMLRRCDELRQLCEANRDSPGAALWIRRSETTARWAE